MMKGGYYRAHAVTLVWHYVAREFLVAACLLLLLFALPVSAAPMRLQDRSLYMESAAPGDTTSYRLSFRYMNSDPIGSVDMLFCIDPIPYHPCVKPPGLDVSNAVLASQEGETGFSIYAQSDNHIIITRQPTAISSAPSTYVFDNIVNPSDTSQAFSIRLRTHTTTDASGDQVDFGSIRGQVTDSITIQTQVPPMLIFCVAEEVADNCSQTNNVFYSDMGALEPDSTLATQSQMAVGTNASGGFAITAIGATLSAGTNVIEPLEEPAESQPGSNQFGINLVANTEPSVGGDPEGPWSNAVVMPDYSIPDRFKYSNGDVVAYSPNVSLMRKFTVSYIVNSHEDLPPGVYSTTITFVASGRF